jgi:hypothetical protein
MALIFINANLPNDKAEELLDWLLKASSYEAVSNKAKAFYYQETLR